MIPPNLIINADDFGLDARVSRGIALCLDEGLINSISVYPFRDAFHGDLLQSILARHPNVRIGAHLAVIGGRLKEHPGHFRDFLAGYLTGRITPSGVEALWRAQIETLGRHLGGTGRIAHLDSHQHLHLLPGLWSAARGLQKEYAVPRLRVPYESLRRGLFHRFPFGLGLQALARLRMERGSPGFIGFFSSTRFTLRANQAALERVLPQPGRAFELMVHPAAPEGSDAAESPVTRRAADPAAPLAPSQETEIAELRLTGEFFERASRA